MSTLSPDFTIPETDTGTSAEGSMELVSTQEKLLACSEGPTEDGSDFKNTNGRMPRRKYQDLLHPVGSQLHPGPSSQGEIQEPRSSRGMLGAHSITRPNTGAGCRYADVVRQEDCPCKPEKMMLGASGAGAGGTDTRSSLIEDDSNEGPAPIPTAASTAESSDSIPETTGLRWHVTGRPAFWD